MNSKNTPTGNKSLFLYTSLIFAAAILIIIVAFFGQQNIGRIGSETETETPPPASDGISQKAAEVSEQNAMLVKQNETLNMLNSELSSDKEELENENTELKINYSNGVIFCSVYQYIYDNDYDDARETLNTINIDSLTDAQKIIYNNLKKILD